MLAYRPNCNKLPATLPIPRVCCCPDLDTNYHTGRARCKLALLAWILHCLLALIAWELRNILNFIGKKKSVCIPRKNGSSKKAIERFCTTCKLVNRGITVHHKETHCILYHTTFQHDKHSANQGKRFCIDSTLCHTWGWGWGWGWKRKWVQMQWGMTWHDMTYWIFHAPFFSLKF